MTRRLYTANPDQPVEIIAWIVTFILVTGLAAVAVAMVAMKEIGL